MPSGLVALLDDVSLIARAAASSLDDMGAAAAKAGSKAAGVVIDDAAVTPSYVTNFTPDRELPIIWAITKGSLKNKLLLLLPTALVLSAFLPWAITPLLMLGGLFLCYEGAEKVMEKLGAEEHGETLEDPIENLAEFERQRISGAIRTDLILSAEIMAIALAELAEAPLVQRGLALAAVGIGITALVYGAVALIVKMDDVGVRIARTGDARAASLGRGLVRAMPVVMSVLSTVGIAAMLWVGGHILLVGLDDLGVSAPYDAVHHLEEDVHDALGAVGGVGAWLANTTASAILGLLVGAIVVAAMNLRRREDRH